MRKEGFVLSLTAEAFLSDGLPTVACADPEQGTADGPGVKLFVSTPATTPESVSSGQPFLQDRLLVAISGRIDNRNEVASALVKPHLKGQSDTMMIASASQRWGSRRTAHPIRELPA